MPGETAIVVGGVVAERGEVDSRPDVGVGVEPDKSCDEWHHPIPGHRMRVARSDAAELEASDHLKSWTSLLYRRDAGIDRLCRLAGRNLTLDEWREFLPDRSPEKTCPQWPAPK